jgi:hypothetical protein
MITTDADLAVLSAGVPYLNQDSDQSQPRHAIVHITADPACDRRSNEQTASERGSILDTHLLDCAAHDFNGSVVAGDQLILPQSLLWDCPDDIYCPPL